VEGAERKGGPPKSGSGCRSSRGGRATWAENQNGPGARGMSETRGPTNPPQMWGLTSEEWEGPPDGCKPHKGEGVRLLCQIIVVVKGQQLCWGTTWGPREEGGTVKLPGHLASGCEQGGRRAPTCPAPSPPERQPGAPCFGRDEHHGFSIPSCHPSCWESLQRQAGLSLGALPLERKQPLSGDARVHESQAPK